ncbi:MAG: hypothetical protein ABIN48_08875 [Ginsengibacter sp.]
MKTLNILVILFFYLFNNAFAQDSTSSKISSKYRLVKQNYDSAQKSNIHFKAANQDFYPDTRLGSSSPLYNTYKKNDYGAGAITTNPFKTGGHTTIFTSPPIPNIPANDTFILHITHPKEINKK